MALFNSVNPLQLSIVLIHPLLLLEVLEFGVKKFKMAAHHGKESLELFISKSRMRKVQI